MMATFEKAILQASTLTQKEMQPHFEKALSHYDDSIEKISTMISLFYGKMPDFTDEERANGALYNWAMQRDRLNKLNSEISKIYTKNSAASGVALATAFKIAVNNVFYRQQYIVTLSTGFVKKFATIPNEIVDASVYGLPKHWKELQKDLIKKIYGSAGQYFPQAGSLSDLLIRNKRDELSKINSALQSGLKNGKGANTISKQIEQIIGSMDEAPFKGAKASAAKIARTEGLRNISSGRLAEMHEAISQGIPVKKQWVTTLDERTRASHGNADGQIRDIDEDFNVGGATGKAPRELNQVGEVVNCRCDMVSMIEGVDPETRSARNLETGKSELIDYKLYNDWAKDNGMTRSKSGRLVPA